MILVAMTNRKDYEQNPHESEQPEKELFLSPSGGGSSVIPVVDTRYGGWSGKTK